MVRYGNRDRRFFSLFLHYEMAPLLTYLNEAMLFQKLTNLSTRKSSKFTQY